MATATRGVVGPLTYDRACRWLQLDPNEELDEITLKKAFRRRAMQEHPDKSNHDDATHRFQMVQHSQELISQQIGRGRTGIDANFEATLHDHDHEDDYDDDDDDDEEGFDMEDIFQHMYMQHLYEQHGGFRGGPFGGFHVRFGGGGGSYGGSRGGSGHHHHHSHGSSSRSAAAEAQAARDYAEQRRQEQQEARQRVYEAQRERQAESIRRQKEYEKEVERQRIAREATIAQEKERRQLWLEQQRQQAQQENRPFFEIWNMTQLKQECKRRNLNNINGLPKESLLELILENETQRRIKRQLKEQAPLLGEWVELYDIPEPNQEWNGIKARAIDFSNGSYTVEWDDSTASKKKKKKKKKQSGHTVHVKPEQVRKWGTAPKSPPPPTPPTSSSPQSQKENKAPSKNDEEEDSKVTTSTKNVDSNDQKTTNRVSTDSENAGQEPHQVKNQTPTKSSEDKQPHPPVTQPAKKQQPQEQPQRSEEGTSKAIHVVGDDDNDEDDNYEEKKDDTPRSSDDNPTSSTAQTPIGIDFNNKRNSNTTNTTTTNNAATKGRTRSGKGSAMDQFERLVKEMEGSPSHKNVAEELASAPAYVQDATTTISPNGGAKFIQHKVQRPKGSKPGDIIEFSNPHIPGQKRKVAIPPNVQPLKFFKVMVPLPPKATEQTIPIPMCAVCSISLPSSSSSSDNDKPSSISLRACTHVCCRGCASSVQGKACPTCNAAVPSLASFDLLPYIQDLDSPPNTVKQALLEEFYCLKESIRTTDKKEQEALDQASSEATKLVDKHYRRASLKVHPDRFGDTYAKEFEALTKARDVLRDTKLRQSYMKEMLEIVCLVGSSYIAKSHDIWKEKHDPDSMDRDRNNSRAPPPGAGKEAPLRLDGGLAYSQPKKPRLVLSSSSSRSRDITIYLPIARGYQFLEYCTRVTVLGSCADMEEDDGPIILIQLKKSQWEVIDNEIRILFRLPQHGIWDISWRATLVIDGTPGGDTPPSSQSRVDLRSDEQRSMVQKWENSKVLAHRRAAEIHNLLRQLKLVLGPGVTITVGGSGHQSQLEEKSNTLHTVLAKGRDCYTKLSNLQRAMGERSYTCPALTSLQEALEAANEFKSQLETMLESYAKKNTRRNFKRFVGNQLERGEAEAWMSSVSEDDLSAIGGDSNRLYQLLIEGKKATALAFNDTTFEAARARTDMFTPKQCQILEKRKEEVAEALAAELESAVEEARKLQAEERERQRMQDKADAVNFSRGTLVKIHDLKARPELNGVLGTYMGIGHADRYIIRLSGNGAEIALKSNNFSKWTMDMERAMESWSCNCCTFVHNDAMANLTTCSMCHAPKGSKPMASTKHPPATATPKAAPASKASATKPASTKVPPKTAPHKAATKPAPTKVATSWACKACSFLHDGHLAALDKCDLCDTPKGLKLATASPTSNSKKPVTSKRQPQQQPIKQPPKPAAPYGNQGPQLNTPTHPMRSLPHAAGKAPPTAPVSSREFPSLASSVASNPSAFKKPVAVPRKIPPESQEFPSLASSVATKPKEAPRDKTSTVREHPKGPPPHKGIAKPLFRSQESSSVTSSPSVSKQPNRAPRSNTSEVQHHPKAHQSQTGKGIDEAPVATHETSSVASTSSASNVSRKSGKPKRCRLGIKCPHLKRGPGHCRFFHPTNETPLSRPAIPSSAPSAPVSVSVPPAIQRGAAVSTAVPAAVGASVSAGFPPATQGAAVSGPIPATVAASVSVPDPSMTQDPIIFAHDTSDSKETKPCRKGLNCAHLKRGATACKFFHPPHEISVYHPNHVSSPREDIAHNEDVTTMSGFPPGFGVSSLLGGFPEESFRVTPTQPAVAPIAPSSSVSLTSTLSGFSLGNEERFTMHSTKPTSAPLAPISRPSSTMTPLVTPQSTPAPAPLATAATTLSIFLEELKGCLKCPPTTFLNWLQSQDILSMEDLAEACSDEDFVKSEMQANGLKGFKRGPFLKAVQNASS